MCWNRLYDCSSGLSRSLSTQPSAKDWQLLRAWVAARRCGSAGLRSQGSYQRPRLLMHCVIIAQGAMGLTTGAQRRPGAVVPNP